MKKWPIITLIVLSALSHFIFFGWPAEVVFDEVHFGKFAAAYDTHSYFFDLHPPLGKLMISAAGALGGFDSSKVDYASIGNVYPDWHYVWYRLLPMIAGFLLPLIIYFLCRRLRMSELAAFLAGMAVILENSILVQSRFIFLDVFILVFGFSSLLLYLKAIQAETPSRYKAFLILAAFFAAFAFSVKWTGASFLGLIILFESWELLKNIKARRAWKRFLGNAGLFAIVGMSTYFLIFAIHLSLLTKTGPGDAFMSPSFQKTLIGNKFQKDSSVKPEGLAAKFFELNGVMLRINETFEATHPYSSKWYTWPLMQRPIYYWVESQSKIYFLGNPLIYWLGSLSVVLLMAFMAIKNKSLDIATEREQSSFLLIGYLSNMLPFIFIGRVMFIYHYLPALVFSIMILAFMVDRIKPERYKKLAVISLICIFLAAFLYFSPLTYGFSVSTAYSDQLFWFKTWI